MPDRIFDLPEIIKTYAACIVYHGLFAYFCVFGPFTVKNVFSLQKTNLPFWQVKTEMCLPESPFFKYSLAGARGLVLMSEPDLAKSTDSSLTMTHIYNMNRPSSRWGSRVMERRTMFITRRKLPKVYIWSTFSFLLSFAIRLLKSSRKCLAYCMNQKDLG